VKYDELIKLMNGSIVLFTCIERRLDVYPSSFQMSGKKALLT
jgi:hypothetical protein